MKTEDCIICDADLEIAELTRSANAMSRLKRKGVCFHNSSIPVVFGESPTLCRECGKVFPSFEAMDAERDELKAEYL